MLATALPWRMPRGDQMLHKASYCMSDLDKGPNPRNFASKTPFKWTLLWNSKLDPSLKIGFSN